MICLLCDHRANTKGCFGDLWVSTCPCVVVCWLHVCVAKALHRFSALCTWNRGFTCGWTCAHLCFFFNLFFFFFLKKIHILAYVGCRQTASRIFSLTVKTRGSFRSCCSLCCYRDNKGALISSCRSSLCRERAGWCNAVCAAPADARWKRVA